MLLTKQELAHKAIEAAERLKVDPAIVCAIIEVSSQWDGAKQEWNPTRWLLGTDPVDVGGNMRWTIMATRWGPMQVLGQEALMLGFKELEKLQGIDGSLEAGCQVLKSFGSNPQKAILQWFGAERKALGKKALFLLPAMKAFVEAKPCVSS